MCSRQSKCSLCLCKISIKFHTRKKINNDAVEEIQLDLTVQQHRVPAWKESLLMSMSDALLRALQQSITSQGYSMKTRCFLSLQTVEPITLSLTRCLGVLTNIPIFAFFPWTVSLSRTFLVMIDWLSFLKLNQLANGATTITQP